MQSLKSMWTQFKNSRFYNKWYAHLHGKFWLPCPICGEFFGGHEWATDLYTSWSDGIGVCPNCIGEAEKRNEKFFRDNPAPVIEMVFNPNTGQYERQY
jgi:hypothetical protein